jgi:WD40 repeat protein
LKQSRARTIATASSDHTIRLWNAKTGRALDCFKEMHVTAALAFRRDGKALTSLGADHTVRVRSVPGGYVTHAFTTRPFQSAAELRQEKLDLAHWPRGAMASTSVLMSVLSPDGTSVATVYGVGKSNCVLWDTATAHQTRSLPLQHWGWGLAFRPNSAGLLALMKGTDSASHLRDVATGRSLHTVYDNDPIPYLGPRFVLSPDGATLIVRELRAPHTAIWNLKTGKHIERVPPKMIGEALYSAFSPDGSILAICENNRELGHRTHLIDMLTGQEIRRLTGAGWVVRMAFSPDGRKLVTASDTAPLVWDVIPRGKDPITEVLWQNLGGDVATAYRAIASCIDAPEKAVPFLARLRPVPHVDAKNVQAWIGNLGSKDYAIREKATAVLRSLEPLPEGPLRERLKDQPPLEMRRRIEQLLRLTEEEWRPTPTELRVMRGIQILESIGNEPARRVLVALAGGAPDARITTAAQQALNRAKARAGVSQ